MKYGTPPLAEISLNSIVEWNLESVRSPSFVRRCLHIKDIF